MLDGERTFKGATMTSDGLIGHKKHQAGFDMPVVLAIRQGGVKKMKEFQPPLRDINGGLIYALPGGGFSLV